LPKAIRENAPEIALRAGQLPLPHSRSAFSTMGESRNLNPLAPSRRPNQSRHRCRGRRWPCASTGSSNPQRHVRNHQKNKIGGSFQNERGFSFQNGRCKRRGWLPKLLMLYIDPLYGATWRSGYATVCKTVYTSSILVVASINIISGLR
jgi:hypothetical protein